MSLIMSSKLCLWYLFFIIVLFGEGKFSYGIQSRSFSVGVVSGPDESSRQNDRKFWTFNNTSSVILEPVVEDIYWWSSMSVTRAVCGLLRTGVHFFVCAVPPGLYRIMQSYSARFRIPMITTHAPIESLRPLGYQASMIPDSSKAVADLLTFYKWESFAYFYDNDNGPAVLEKILEAMDNRINVEALWRVSSGEEAQRFLQLLRYDNKTPCRILLSTKEQLLDEIISTMPSGVGLKRRFHYVLVNPLSITDEGGKYNAQGSFTITKFSLGNTKNPAYLDLENRWHTLQRYQGRGSLSKTVPKSAVTIRDIAEVLQNGVIKLLREAPSFNITSRGVDCLADEAGNSPAYPNALTNSIKNVVLPAAMTGRVQFSASGERTNYIFNVLEYTPFAIEKVGEWSSKKGLNFIQDPATQSQNDNSFPPPRKDGLNMKKKFRVTSIVTPPYLTLKENSENYKGNNRYKGFIMDLLEALCQNLDCDYEVNLVKDGYYGMKKGQRWNGMIGEVIREEADFVAASLTVTTAREDVLDFSKPFMVTGLNILVKKPDDTLDTSNIGVLGFLRVWTYEVWLLLALAFLVLGAGTYAISYYTGEPDRIRSLDTKLSDRLSLCSSFWFIFGLLTFRETGIYPRSVSHRLLSVVWWIFSLSLLAFYISSLTAQLIRARTTSQTTHSLSRSSDILQQALTTGYPKLGVNAGGSTERFFKESEVGLYKDFGKYLTAHPEYMVKSYKDAFERIRASDGGYAMVMESTSTEHFSNLQPCDTMDTAGYLDHKFYALAFKKGSLLRESFDHALLDLTEAGIIRRLYEKWWHHKKTCEDPYMNILPSVYSNSLTLKEVSGVFYILIIGCCIATLTGTVEYFVRSKRVSVEDN